MHGSGMSPKATGDRMFFVCEINKAFVPTERLLPSEHLLKREIRQDQKNKEGKYNGGPARERERGLTPCAKSTLVLKESWGKDLSSCPTHLRDLCGGVDPKRINFGWKSTGG